MINAVVTPMYKPNVDDMREHVEHIFGGFLDGYHDGLIELAWTNTVATAGKYKLANAKLFGTDQIEELVQHASELNSTPYCNVYIGAALRRPGTPDGRSLDAAAWALTAYYTDLDDDGAAARAKEIYGLAKPTLVVQTGQTPHLRGQCWWRLNEPLTDPEQWPASIRGIAVGLSGDTTVTNPGRVMRLAGSVAWPVKPGRVVEVTQIRKLTQPGARIYDANYITALFPPIAEKTADEINTGAEDDGIVHTTNSLGLIDKIADGREKYMRKTIAACLIEFIGENGAAPSAQELFDLAWPQYQRKVDFSRPGRGKDEFAQKCRYTVARFERGEIKGVRNLDEAVEVYRAKKESQKAVRAVSIRQGEAKEQEKKVEGKSGALLLSAAEFVSDFTPPAYLVDGIIQRGYLYSLTARTGHGKTAVSMFLGQAVARAQTLQMRKVKQGAVLFLAGENPDDIRARFLVLASHHNFSPADVQFHFVAGVIDIEASLPRITDEASKIDNLQLVIVDTAAAYYKGDDGNSNVQQGGFARVLRQLTFLPGKPAVITNCHPPKGALRDNLVPVGGGAFLNEVDGNLTLWADGDDQTTLHWQGKFRGPEFDPITFKMETSTCDEVKDADGRLMPSIIARPISEVEIELGNRAAETDENILLGVIAMNSKCSVSDLAKKANWFSSTGLPAKSKVFRVAERLLADKLIARGRGGKFKATKEGRKECGLDDE